MRKTPVKKGQGTNDSDAASVATFSLTLDVESSLDSTHSTLIDGVPALEINMASVVGQGYTENFKKNVLNAEKESPEVTREEVIDSLLTTYWDEALDGICDALLDGDVQQARLVEVVIDGAQMGAAEMLGLTEQQILQVKENNISRHRAYRDAVETSERTFLANLRNVLKENRESEKADLISNFHRSVVEELLAAFNDALEHHDHEQCQIKLALLEGLLMASAQLYQQSNS